MDTHHVVQKHWRATEERIEKFLSKIYFTDVNLRGRLYPARTDLLSLRHYNSKKPQTYHEIVECLLSVDEVLVKDVNIGPSWSTHWFKCDMVIPKEWTQREVRFRWDSGCEAMIWMDGHPVQGLTGSSDSSQLRTDFILTKSAKGGERFIVYVEAACNGMFGVGRNGMINPCDENRHFSLNMVEIAVFDWDVYNLINDLSLMIDMAKHLPRDHPRAHEALYTANKVVSLCDPFNKETFTRCREVTAQFMSERNGDSSHVLHVMGHCHIDSAWLWPYSETRRKCGRSWSSTLRLMEDYPQFTFVCSQAQQLQWVKEDYPILYQAIQKRAASGQFVPVGGTWIEMDGNIPSGESFVRQFLFGQRFFKEEFGHYCKEFWLPDTFGYSAQLPQIMQGAGISYFLSQKLSWNLTNQFPHNSFIWEGIDGSSVLVHFPPADTYESIGDVKDVVKSVKQFRDKGRSRRSVLLFGHGDGGGGPTEDMLESLKRMENIDGLAKVQFSTPVEFFDGLRDEDAPELCKWVGELYLELHRGTYTTHAQIKKENRQGEFLLHDLDFVTALSFALSYNMRRVERVKAKTLSMWRKFLLNQFHDVLPGSCIGKVAEDALTYYHEVKSQAEVIISEELDVLASQVWGSSSLVEEPCAILVNSFCWERWELVKHDRACEASDCKKPRLEGGSLTQTLVDGSIVGMVRCEPMSIQPLVYVSPRDTVKVTSEGEAFIMENGLLRAVLSQRGLLISLVYKPTGRESIVPGSVGNQLVLFDDVPLYWDAWDVMEYHLETRVLLTTTNKGEACIMDVGPLRASLQVEFKISAQSHVTQVISLDAESPYLRFDTKVNWHESHKFLKVEFPLNVRSHEAQYEIQFGHLSRPTHYNTSWDQAKFEVCAQKWADLSEHGFGIALLNDCKYGYSTIGNVMRLSLLRAPKAPDEHADMGEHSLAYALLPHKGSLQDGGVIQTSFDFNHPITVRQQHYAGDSKSFFKLECPEGSSIVLDTLKPLERESDGIAIVIRVYEAFGSHSSAQLTTSLPVDKCQRCNLLEEPLDREPLVVWDICGLKLQLKPFEIATFILYVHSQVERDN